MNRVALLTLMWCVGLAPAAAAQDETPARIGLFVVDVHGNVPKFGSDPELALSRGLAVGEMPGAGLGLTGGVHLYPLRIGPVTVGVGGQAMIGRSKAEPAVAEGQTTTLRPVTETFKSFAPQVSLNFGNASGWSYLSVGIGRSLWSIVPGGRDPLPIDEQPIPTINYGGGARWFAKDHLAFSLDVRLYEIKNSFPPDGGPGSPRTVLLVIGAGISVR